MTEVKANKVPPEECGDRQHLRPITVRVVEQPILDLLDHDNTIVLPVETLGPRIPQEGQKALHDPHVAAPVERDGARRDSTVVALDEVEKVLRQLQTVAGAELPEALRTWWRKDDLEFHSYLRGASAQFPGDLPP